MTRLSQIILENYQVRKTRAQKLEFEQILKNNGVDFTVVEGGFLKSRNLVVGNPKTAKVLLTAHYDTCARLPVPNLIFPKNIFFTLLYGLVFGIPVFAGILFTDSLIIHLFKYGIISVVLSGILLITTPFLCLFLFFFMLMGPIQNKHTANDNTSGVITLLELMEKLDDETKEKVAFVFFDNEENGLLGSSYYRKVHKKETANQLIINFDCVSDGDNIMLIYNKGAEKFLDKLMFKEREGKNVLIEKSSRAFYPSDQFGFRQSIAVAALNKSALGLYIGRIHTNRDVIFDESNIEYITSEFKDIVANIVNE